MDGYDLERIEALLKEATPGPWEWDVMPVQLRYAGVDERVGERVIIGRSAPVLPGDRALISAAVNALPSMIADLKLLREARDSGALEWALFLAEAEQSGVRFSAETETDRFTATLRRLASGEPT